MYAMMVFKVFKFNFAGTVPVSIGIWVRKVHRHLVTVSVLMREHEQWYLEHPVVSLVLGVPFESTRRVRNLFAMNREIIKQF